MLLEKSGELGGCFGSELGCIDWELLPLFDSCERLLTGQIIEQQPHEAEFLAPRQGTHGRKDFRDRHGCDPFFEPPSLYRVPITPTRFPVGIEESSACYGNRRPELVRRFEAIPMLALEKEHFVELLRASLHTLGKRFGFINANLRLVSVDDSAVDLLYEASREVCAYSEDGLRHIGFGGTVPGVRIRTPAQLAVEQDLFFDMRHVSRAFEQLGGESVRQFAEEQYDRGWHRQRNHPRQVKLVGDPLRGRIVLVDVQETNGHTGSGQLESDRADRLIIPL
jgi:hypothetical protein